jgi:hypothetical protein
LPWLAFFLETWLEDQDYGTCKEKRVEQVGFEELGSISIALLFR